MKTNIKQLTEKLKSICKEILEIEDINENEKYAYYARSIICHILVKNFQINPHSFCKYLNVKKNEVDNLTREAEINMVKNNQDFKWAYSQIIHKI
jgi:hypothetical protein